MSDNMTTETQHTPGEWTIQPDGKSAYFLPIVDDRGCYICAVSERTDAGEAKANARLIATSPTMYDLLRELTDPNECWYDHHGYCQAHGLSERPCPHERARGLFAALGT